MEQVRIANHDKKGRLAGIIIDYNGEFFQLYCYNSWYGNNKFRWGDTEERDLNKLWTWAISYNDKNEIPMDTWNNFITNAILTPEVSINKLIEFLETRFTWRLPEITWKKIK